MARKQYLNYVIAPMLSESISLNELVIFEQWIDDNNIQITKQWLYNTHYTIQYMNISSVVTPILLLNKGVELLSGHQLYYRNEMNTQIDVTASYYQGGYIEDGVSVGNTYDLIYPRTKIDDVNALLSSIEIASDSNRFYDFNVGIVRGYPTITYGFNSGILPGNLNPLINYNSSRSTLQFYNDSIEVSKKSAFPVASYNVTFAYLKDRLNLTPSYPYNTTYTNLSKDINDGVILGLGSIVRINDPEMKVVGMRGIISDIALDLEHPENNAFTIQNYKTRFDEVYGRMMASSEQMYTRGTSYERAAMAIEPTQEIKADILQKSIQFNSLVFTSGYSNGVTFGEDGILVENLYPYSNGVTGLLVLRGGSILLSDTVDAEGNRIFHTGITPHGINASVLNAGRINTEKITIYSGNQVRFTWKADGLFAYKYGLNGFDTNFNEWVRFNEDGLIYSHDNGATTALSLGWDGLIINSEDGSLKLNPADGLEITGQDGAVKLTSAEGLKIFAPNDILKVWLGEFADNSYGLNIYDNYGNSVFKTYDNNGLGRLYLAGNLDVGFNGTNNVLAGISGNTKGNLFTDQQVIDFDLSDDVPQFQLDTSIRFFSGYDDSASYLGHDVVVPKFTVLHNGTVFASDAIIKGTIYATDGVFSGVLRGASGDFTGRVTATEGMFTGTIHALNGTIDGLLTVTNGEIRVGDSGFSNGMTQDTNNNPILFWLGGTFDENGKLISSALEYSALTGLNLTGNINATSLNLQNHMYLRNGVSGIGIENVPTVDLVLKDIRFWAGADTTPTLNIDTSHNSYFYVEENGTLAAKSAIIDGDITVQNGYVKGNLIIDNANNYSTVISGILTQPIMTTIYNDETIFKLDRDGTITSKNLMLTGNLTAQNNATLHGDLIVGENSSIMSANYISGAAGWRIGYSNNDYYAELVNVKIRGELTSSVFKYDTISAVGGELWVRPSIILTNDVTLSYNEITGYSFSIAKQQYPELSGFKNGQKLLLQAIVYEQLTNTAIDIQLTAKAVYSTNDTVLIQDIEGSVDMEQVSSILAGSSIISEVTGASDVGIKLTAIDPFGPYIDIYSGDQSSIVRVGNLSGIYSEYFGNLTGYGLYAADAYLTGKVYLPNAGITNYGNDPTSIRFWAGASPENMSIAPFRVLQDGSMFASRGTFSGTIIAEGGSSFTGAIHTAGVVIDDANNDHFFVAYTANPTSDDDYLINLSKDGLDIYEGGLRVFSDWANGWRNDTKTDEILLPYGGNNKVPYFSMNDEKMRWIGKAGHFYTIAPNNSYQSILVDDGVISFSSGSVAGTIEETENSIASSTTNIKYNNGLEVNGSQIVINGATNVDVVTTDMNIKGDISNSATTQTTLGTLQIQYTDSTIEFYYRDQS